MIQKTFPATVILVIIIALSLLFRSYLLSTIPPSLFSDEVDAGYQALTFNHRLTDYFGNKFPIHFHSFSDYRTSLYIYSIALFQTITHNPELSVRLPAVIFSLISVLLVYLISHSLFTTFLMAISPWSIHFGRTGFEVSGMLMVILAGIYFWQRYLSYRHLIYLILSALFFCLSPYFYSTAKLFLPIILVIIFFVWFSDIKKIKRNHLLLAILLGALFLLPLLVDTLIGKSGFRFSYISIFTMPHREQITDTLRHQDILLSHPNQIGVSPPLLSYLFHNKYQLVLQQFTTNYISSFSTNFLFLHGDENLRQGFGNHGPSYIIDLFTIIIGVFFALKSKNNLAKFFLWLLILAPFPFALTRDSATPHATRLILMLPSIIYFSGQALQKLPILLPIYCLLFINFWHIYTIHYPQLSARYWHTGMKQAVLTANTSNVIYFSDSYEPFLPFFLFYNSYFPDSNHSLASEITPIQNDYFTGSVLNNQFYFGRFDRSSIPANLVNTTFVMPLSEFKTLPDSNRFTIITTIKKTYTEQEEFIIFKT